MIFAHLASLALNWKDDTYILRKRFRFWKGNKSFKLQGHGSLIRCIRLAIVVTFAFVDTTLVVLEERDQNVSWRAHMAGALTGFVVGIIVLKNRKVEYFEVGLRRACIVLFFVFMFSLIITNAVGTHWNDIGDEPHEDKCQWPF